MKQFLLIFALVLWGCATYETIEQEQSTGRILWESPQALSDGSFWLSSESQRKYEAQNMVLGDHSVSFFGLEPGWYKINFQNPNVSTRGSGWIPVYAGWEAGMVWDCNKNIRDDLQACRASLYSLDPNRLLEASLPVDPTTQVEESLLVQNFPYALSDEIMVLTHNHPGALMGKGGLSSSWSRGSSYHRKTSSSPWFFIASGEPNGFLEYLLITQNSTDMQDAFNPQSKTIDDMGKGNGYLTWSSSPALNQLLPLDDPEKKGALQSFFLEGVQEGYQKEFTVYLPPGYSDTHPPYKTIYFHDAQMHLQYGITNAFDRWISEGSVEPFLAVLVNNDRNYRSHEFLPDEHTPSGWGQDRLVETRIASGELPSWFIHASEYYQRLWGEQLIPRIESVYNVSSDPADRAIHGASNGSVISFIILNRYPDLFGNAACVSGFSGETDLSRLGEIPLNLYFSYGRYELPTNEIGFMETQIAEDLKEQSLVNLLTGPYPGGHDPISWANDLPRIMDFWWED